MGAYRRGVEHLDEMRRAAQTSKRLEDRKRQKRFQTEFQGPNSGGRARQVMLCSVK